MVQDAPVRVVIGRKVARAISYPEESYLHIANPAEAIRAIDANTKGALSRYLRGPGAQKLYKVAIGRRDNLLDPQSELHNPSGSGDIYILPAVRGRSSGWGKILAGVALIALAIFMPVTAWAAVGSMFGVSAGTAAFGVAMLGASLALGGITQLLTPTPNFNENSVGDSRGGTIFGGNDGATSQGGAVGLVYGRALVAPMPISLSYTAVDQSSVSSFAEGEYDVVVGPGGIIDYVPNFPGGRDNLPTESQS